jgi:TonB dependent receptor.
MSLLLYDYDTSYGNYITPDGVWRPSLTPTQNANPDLKWENTQEINVGLDFGLFHGRLFGSVDAYYKLTTDLLWDYSVPVPPNLYGSTTANVGAMSNRGVELMLGGVPVRTRNFEWTTTLTAAHNKNILESLSNDLYETEDYIDGAWTEEPTSMVLQRTYIGGSLGDFYMLKSTGLGTSKSSKGLWMIENPATGESDMFVDGMRSYDSSYRQYLGSGLPIVTLGWSNTFRLFNFDLTMAFSSQLGHKIFNCQRMFYENLNIGLNRYKSAVLPVYGGVLSPSQQPVAVSYYLEDGDYLKLDNLNLGYTFNTSKVKYLDRARIFFSGENVFCLTKYQGIDPEMSTSDRFGFGVDYRNKYPTIRTWTVGVNLTFGNK